VEVWCAEENWQARSFYEKHGFRLYTRTDTYNPDDGVEVPLVCYTLDRSASQAEGWIRELARGQVR
jgi:ribosomal protein S18 acetylase RimI-like enzyme